VLIDDNHDSYPDLVATGSNFQLKLYHNDGTGTFTWSQSLPYMLGWPMAVGDLNGDEDDDLAISTEFGAFVIFNTPNGLDWEYGTFISWADSDYELVQPYDLLVLDLDGDELNDLMVLGGLIRDPYGEMYEGPATIRWSMGLDGGGLSDPYWQNFEPLGSEVRETSCADLDHDGDLDLVCASTGYLDDAIFFYDDAGNSFIRGGNPFADVAGFKHPVKLALIDEDDEWDGVVLHHCPSYPCTSIVYRGLGSGSFEWIQDLYRLWWGVHTSVEKRGHAYWRLGARGRHNDLFKVGPIRRQRSR
jgi:hypothetical protein